MTAPTEEEFKAWWDDPVTTYVRKAYENMAEAQKKHWCAATWDGGGCDSYLLAELRARADAYKSMSEMDLSDIIAANEPEAE